MKKVSADIKPNELMIIFSLSGTTDELVFSAENAKSVGAKLITCTCTENSPLVKMADIPLWGYKHKHTSITTVDVTSRFPLYVLSRIIIDYLIMEK